MKYLLLQVNFISLVFLAFSAGIAANAERLMGSETIRFGR